MEVVFDKSFLKSLRKINNKSVKYRLYKQILILEERHNLKEIPNIKKIQGFKNYHRLRIGDYRLGFELENPNKIRLIVFSHRKNIYNIFP